MSNNEFFFLILKWCFLTSSTTGFSPYAFQQQTLLNYCNVIAWPNARTSISIGPFFTSVIATFNPDAFWHCSQATSVQCWLGSVQNETQTPEHLCIITNRPWLSNVFFASLWQNALKADNIAAEFTLLSSTQHVMSAIAKTKLPKHLQLIATNQILQVIRNQFLMSNSANSFEPLSIMSGAHCLSH